MKFDFDEFAVVARDAFIDEFKEFCTSGDVTPHPILEAAYGTAGIAYITELKKRLFDDDRVSKDVTVDEFDAICVEVKDEVAKTDIEFLTRFGMVIVLAEITVRIKKHYKLYNDEEESNGNN